MSVDTFVAIIFIIGIVILGMMGIVKNINAEEVAFAKKWQCTQSEVVSNELPKQEICTQYTRRKE